jgi:hypothetical protein
MASKPKINPDGNGFVSMEEFIRTRDSGKHQSIVAPCVLQSQLLVLLRKRYRDAFIAVGDEAHTTLRKKHFDADSEQFSLFLTVCLLHTRPAQSRFSTSIFLRLPFSSRYRQSIADQQ